MHFSVPALVTLTMSAGLATAASLPSILPSTACLQIPSVIQAVDFNRLVDQAQQEICNNGCKFTLSESEASPRNFLVSVIENETKNMGTPQFNPQYTSALDSVFGMARTQCGAGDADLCAMDASEVKTMAQCVKANTWRVFLDNAVSLWGPLTTNCQTQYDFFSNPALWEEKVPAYFREFADSCEKN
ncbi:hypothetical protein CNMCM5793_004554 [Aspergillus hiratsukae]|uniref:Uncharacterized protein n=1 Tax=Aspergillus hiratsukae TaxID=1194566 RepID=A0A8H6UIZ7_9EURO|nr:hypothetical protein CNMCM5793_004554 [Aspergillus hiratsukae]KAF7170379.1 hypothetical protein CNMCM6106_005108 [Aspergillus hiratsukae]